MTMKNLRLILLFLLPAVANLMAWAGDGVFVSGEKYRIECNSHRKGGVTTGTLVGNEAPLYYVDDPSSPDIVMWVVTRCGDDGKGHAAFTIQHAVTRKYVTYDGLRGDYKRYVDMTDEAVDEASWWTFTDWGGRWSINNVKAPEHHWHVRSSLLTGTYAEESTPGASSLFRLLTAEGEEMTTFDAPQPTLHSLLGGLKIDGKPAVFDRASGNYLMPTLVSHFSEKAWSPVVNFDSTHGSLSIGGKVVADGDAVKMYPISNGYAIKLKFTTNEGEVLTGKLIFTCLPVVELNGTAFNASSDQPGTIRVNDPENNGPDPLLKMKAHWRGNTSVQRPKKNYAVKLLDEDGQKLDYKFLGMRSDNNWILDGMLSDVARMRNRVTTDIWNDYHVAPYYGDQEPKARTATRGKFVEMMLNGEYAGIYCLTEKMDRKQLKLKKINMEEGEGKVPQHGILYKAVEWHYTTYFGYGDGGFNYIEQPEPLAGKDGWTGWEIKYPDASDGEPLDWTPLWDHVKFMMNCTDTRFRREAEDRFDLPALMDYYLLIDLSFALDNSAKNTLWFIYDAEASTKLSVGPWDLDATWGREWDGSVGRSDPTKLLADLYGDIKTKHKVLSMLMRLNLHHWNEDMAERYCELRHSGVFAPDSICRRFSNYASRFIVSGASEREIERWSGADGINLNWTQEMPYIESWVQQHAKTLDAFYGYDPDTYVPVGLSSLPSDQGVAVIPGHGTLTLRSLLPRRVSVTTLSGQPIATLDLTHGETTLTSLSPGIYLAAGRKVVVR